MKVLWCSDIAGYNTLNQPRGLPSGYAQVTRNLLSRFRKAGIDCHQLSFQFFGMDDYVPWPLHYNINHDEVYGNKNSVAFWTNKEKPDIVAFLGDAFMIQWLAEDKIAEKDGKKVIIKKRDEINAKTLFYFPFDSPDVYPQAKAIMPLIDYRVAMSKFGQKLLKKQTGIDSLYVPHGVDTNIYRPLKEEFINIEKVNHKFEDKFIIGAVGRNQTRKMWPYMFDAYKRFKKKYKKSMLLMHMDPLDPHGWNMLDMCKNKGLEPGKDVYFSMKRYSYGENEPTVNFIYNMMDIHMLPTSGEGFGIPIIESMAAGVPNLVTDCTTAPELLNYGKCGMLVKRVGELEEEGYLTGQINTQRAIPSVKDMLDKMIYLYENESERIKMGQRARAFILKNYNWEKVVRAWLELFDHGKITEYKQEVK